MTDVEKVRSSIASKYQWREMCFNSIDMLVAHPSIESVFIRVHALGDRDYGQPERIAHAQCNYSIINSWKILGSRNAMLTAFPSKTCEHLP